MRGALQFNVVGHHEDASAYPHHVDVRSIKLRQDRTVDDLVDAPDRGVAVPDCNGVALFFSSFAAIARYGVD
ncbi:hypothetical protein FJW06_15110 [Mesorhizobium sp. B4-1-3]|uniref:hypothetical protein n=1 Tax=Mesorhizobium sp. B4-1-3 TaxID=2589889 RepID=UPI00112961E4|nr:hypothetical protein [Mesorhizobium sp. B4-1-3]TPI12993.1 hypothetical protein FJW06_15110 [Mesorhizobium sp. B4-1-3]